MTIALSKTKDEIKQMPLVELACEILRANKEPLYFRDLMTEIKGLRALSEDQAMDVISRLYTEINIDGRFICVGQNVWGLKRWYPVDKVADKASTAKKFVRRTGDAFSDDEEDVDLEEDDFHDELTIEEEVEDPVFTTDDDADDTEAEAEEDFVVVDEEGNFAEEEEEDTELSEETPFVDEEAEEESEDDENY